MTIKKCIIKTLFLVSSIYIILTNNLNAQEAIFSKAVFYFDFASNSESQNRGLLLQVGKVATGISLKDAEYQESLKYGGDGKVGRIESGYFIADAYNPLPSLDGYEMTICLRVKDESGGWRGALLSYYDANNAYRILNGVDNNLVYEWHTTKLKYRVDSAWLSQMMQLKQNWTVPNSLPDLLNGRLTLNSPASLTGDGWHTIMIRFNKAKLELFIDGVLINEEFPNGNLQDFRCPFLIGGAYNENRFMMKDFKGLIDHFAVWNYALTDSEIVSLNGGRELISAKKLKWFGSEPTSMQYFKPIGYDQSAGDCMPFYYDGVFHLFYLQTRHHHHGKWETGGTQFAQLTSTDLIHFTQQPLAVPFTEQWESGIGTGDAFFFNGKYYLFYTDCGSRMEYKDKPHKGSRIFTASGTDGIHFTLDNKPVLDGEDAAVFLDKETGKYCLITHGDDCYVSDDFKNWTLYKKHFLPEKKGTSVECPNHFEWNGWHYYILGRNAIWKSKNTFGPFEEIAPAIYGGVLVPKVTEYKENRRLSAGFLVDYWYGGYLVLRELTQDNKGNIYTRFVPELIPATLPEIHLTPEPGSKNTSNQIRIESDGNVVKTYLSGLPANCRIRMRIIPGTHLNNFGLSLRSEPGFVSGCELRFEPDSGRFCIGTPRLGNLSAVSSDPPEWGYNYSYTGISIFDKAFDLDIIIKNSIADICIDNKRCMTTYRRNELPGDKLYFFATHGNVQFTNIIIEPLQ